MKTMIPSPRNRKGTGKLVPVNPAELFPKSPEIKTSHDALEEDLAKHAANASRRFNNMLIKPQKKIISEVLLDSAVGDKIDVRSAMDKMDEQFGNLTEYYAYVGNNFDLSQADYNARYNMMHPERFMDKDENGNPVIHDYDELNGGYNPNNLDSVMYHRMVNGLPYGEEDLTKPIEEDNTNNKNESDEGEVVDASLFNF